MDWLTIGKKVAALGLPVLGSLLLGPIGGSVGTVIANALGVPNDPAAVGARLDAGDNDVIIQKLKSAEAESVAMVEAQAKVSIAASADVNTTMRGELVGAGEGVGAFGMFQRGWRPAFGWLLIFECFIFLLLLLHEAFTGDFATMTALLQHEDFLKWFFGFQFGVVGVFGAARSQEKVAAINATANAPADTGLIGGIVADVMKRLKR